MGNRGVASFLHEWCNSFNFRPKKTENEFLNSTHERTHRRWWKGLYLSIYLILCQVSSVQEATSGVKIRDLPPLCPPVMPLVRNHHFLPILPKPLSIRPRCKTNRNVSRLFVWHLTFINFWLLLESTRHLTISLNIPIPGAENLNTNFPPEKIIIIFIIIYQNETLLK